jgi:hypothetical protein
VPITNKDFIFKMEHWQVSKEATPGHHPNPKAAVEVPSAHQQGEVPVTM